MQRGLSGGRMCYLQLLPGYNISIKTFNKLILIKVPHITIQGQMVSDVLEIALKARSHALGPLHPSFNIVEILKNGLRRFLEI